MRGSTTFTLTLAFTFTLSSAARLVLRCLKANATFCIEPPGFSPTRKSTIDALLHGCIPVTFLAHKHAQLFLTSTLTPTPDPKLRVTATGVSSEYTKTAARGVPPRPMTSQMTLTARNHQQSPRLGRPLSPLDCLVQQRC